jgi:hypothetical protein
VNCLNENKQLLEVHLKEKRSLENKEEELEEERVSELKEKLENAKRQYGEMKNNLVQLTLISNLAHCKTNQSFSFIEKNSWKIFS